MGAKKVSLYPADSGAERGTRHFGPENYSSTTNITFPSSGRKNSLVPERAISGSPSHARGTEKGANGRENNRQISDSFFPVKIEREKRKKCLREDYCMLYMRLGSHFTHCCSIPFKAGVQYMPKSFGSRRLKQARSGVGPFLIRLVAPERSSPFFPLLSSPPLFKEPLTVGIVPLICKQLKSTNLLANRSSFAGKK